MVYSAKQALALAGTLISFAESVCTQIFFTYALLTVKHSSLTWLLNAGV